MHGSTLDENPESPLIFQETQGRKWSRNVLLEGQEMASRQYCKLSIRLTNMKEYPNTKEYMRRTVNSCEKQENPGREEVVSASSYCFCFSNNYMISTSTIKRLASIYRFSYEGEYPFKIKLLEKSFILPKAHTNKKFIHLFKNINKTHTML